MSIRSDLRRKRLELAGFRCEWPICDKWEPLEMAHLTQLSQGGPDTIDNVCMLCNFHHDILDNRLVHGRRAAVVMLLQAYVSGTPRPAARDWVT